MRQAGRVVAEMHEVCTRAAKPGATTADLDAAAREVLDRRGARSNFLGYHGFPAVACISPNEVIVHGIPGDAVLEDGDIVSIDCGAIIEGWHADAAITVPVGDDRRRVAAADRRDPAVARRRDRAGRRSATGSATSAPRSRRSAERPDSRSCASTSATASAPRCTRSPRSRTTAPPGRGMRLQGGHGARDRADGQRGQAPRPACWPTAGPSSPPTARRSAHFEHTVAVTDDGPEVLTLDLQRRLSGTGDEPHRRMSPAGWQKGRPCRYSVRSAECPSAAPGSPQ